MAHKRRLAGMFAIGVALAGLAAPATARPIDDDQRASVTACQPGQPCPPDHAIIVCQSASFYEGYNSASGPYGFKWTLYYGNKVGHTRGAHPIHNGWASTFDYGPNVWGVVRYECLGGWDSW